MKKLLLGLLVATALVSCKENSNTSYPSNSDYVPMQGEVMDPVIASSTATPGLNLSDLTNLVKNSSTAEEIESKLNSAGSFNQLDMDGDGYSDYIKVNELPGDGAKRGFTFSVDLPDGNNQEVATVMIDKSGNMANLNAMGNPNIYGHGATYHSSHLLTDLMIMHYLFGAHRPYYSPYHYGYYPRTYAYHDRVSNRSVTTRTVTTTTKKVSPSTSSLTSANKTVVNDRTKTLSNPTTSKKSFTVTSAEKSKPVTTGFKSSNTVSSTPKARTSSFGSSNTSSSYKPNRSSTPSSTSFGSSSKTTSKSSSFGSSNKSSSSSYSSSKSSSRSSSFGSSSRSSSRSSSSRRR